MVLISLVPALTPLYLYVSTFRSMCAVPNMAVFCSSLTSWFPRMLLTYFLNDFEIVPVAPIITGITFVFTFHMRCISIVRTLYFRMISAFFKTHFCLLKLQHLLTYMFLLQLSCHPVAVVLRNCCICLVDSFECMMMHGLANPTFFGIESSFDLAFRTSCYS